MGKGRGEKKKEKKGRKNKLLNRLNELVKAKEGIPVVTKKKKKKI